MVAIVFSIVSGTACLFLSYAFLRFNQELTCLRQVRSSVESKPVHRKVVPKESNYFPECIVAEDPMMAGAMVRRDVLVNGILGLLGLAAPFIFIRLLNSPIFHR